MKIEKYGVIHQTAHCQNCSKTNEDYSGGKARKWGYTHAKSTGHTVIVETGTAIQYN